MKRILDVDFDFRSNYKKKMKVSCEDEEDVEVVTLKDSDGMSHLSDSDNEVNRYDSDVGVHELVREITHGNLHVDKVNMANLTSGVLPKVKKNKKHSI